MEFDAIEKQGIRFRRTFPMNNGELHITEFLQVFETDELFLFKWNEIMNESLAITGTEITKVFKDTLIMVDDKVRGYCESYEKVKFDYLIEKHGN